MRRAYLLPFSLMVAVLLLGSLACSLFTGLLPTQTTPEQPAITSTPRPTPTALPPIPVQPGAGNPDEPVYVYGDIPYTSPFFVNSLSEPFILLEDQAGFVTRDREFEFNLPGQMIGPVEVYDDGSLTYSLPLPSIPLGTYVDVDNNGSEDKGVQVFAAAYWSNTWGGPFLEERDGTGWSTAYASTLSDPENEDEITGGTLIVWSPDDGQAFPTGFGEDGLLFTADDPTAPIPAGYNIVDLNDEPFQVYKEARPEITLNEGVVAVNDYTEDDYATAFQKLHEKVAREYPFTAEKKVDWQALYDRFAPRMESAGNANEFYAALRDFTWSIPDAHVGVSINAEIFYQEQGGSFGIRLAELSDGRVIVVEVLPDTTGAGAGLVEGTEILTWDGKPVQEALAEVVPYFGPFSTEHHKHLEQLVFLTRLPPNTQIEIGYRLPNGREEEKRLRAEVEYESLFRSIPELRSDPLVLPVSVRLLEDSSLGYIRIDTFSDDYHLMAQLWEDAIRNMIDNEIPGLIIDLRTNGGGSSGLAYDFAGYLFDEEIVLYQGSYYNERLGEFEFSDYPARVKPGPLYYEGPVAVLVSPYCVSACEGFAYALSQGGRSTIVGHFPTAGAFGEVGRGQYELPDEISMQFPTGRPETMNGNLLIEGAGVQPDIVVPVTEDSALERVDAVLDAAIQSVLEQLDN